MPNTQYGKSDAKKIIIMNELFKSCHTYEVQIDACSLLYVGSTRGLGELGRKTIYCRGAQNQNSWGVPENILRELGSKQKLKGLQGAACCPQRKNILRSCESNF